MIAKRACRKCGFTIIEVIVTLVLIGIVCSTMFAYFNMLPKSSAPTVQVTNTENLHAAMEKIVSNFIFATTQSNSLPTLTILQNFQATIGNVGSSNPNYGNVTIVANQIIMFDATNTEAPYDGSSTHHPILKVSISNSHGGILTNLLIVPNG